MTGGVDGGVGVHMSRRALKLILTKVNSTSIYKGGGGGGICK